MSTTSNSFLQSNIAYCDEKGPQRIMSFGKREIFCKLKKDLIQWHIDATFDCSPPGFYQCLIISVFEEELNMFLPCYYVLMTNKTLTSYILALSMMNITVGPCKPGYVMHDFEAAIPKAVKRVFPNAKTTGCLFHFKQCLTRNMMKLSIPKDIAFKQVGWFDLLTVVPKDEIFSKALPFIEFNLLAMKEAEMEPWLQKSWNKFFEYVKRTFDNANMISLMNYSDKIMDL